MNLVNKGDLLESYTKLKQRGVNYFLEKLNLNPHKRTQSTFNPAGADGSNWWIIPEVKLRENERLTGNSQKTFDIYLNETYFQDKNGLKLLSVACGIGNREIRIAESGHFDEVLGIDLSKESINEASRKAAEKGLSNIHFEQADFYSYKLAEDYFDVVLFYSALHHFKNIEKIVERVSGTLKKGGLIVLCEYIGRNRLQFPKDQLIEMNRLLNFIPKQFRTRYLTSIVKKRVYAPGLLRMRVSDPSEAVESESILPVIHREFEVLEEKRIGGDLLMMVLKDIAHHFISEDAEAKLVLERLFLEEEEYLKDAIAPDFIFGVYRKRS